MRYRMSARFAVTAWRGLLLGACVAAFLAAAGGGHARAIDIVIDYTYDTQGFFGSGNPDGAGAQAAATLEAAAAFYSENLTDTFSAISTPPPFVNGPAVFTWTWSSSFFHPGTGEIETVVDAEIAQDAYVVYVGGRSLEGDTAGRGGPGAAGVGFSGSRFPSDIPTIDAITADFEDAAERRGEAAGFASWGGSLTFDNDGSTPWHYGLQSPPPANQTDFFSVALHELGHVLGLGLADEWDALTSQNTFTGANAVASFGGAPPVVPGHFAQGVTSTRFGTTDVQEALMAPSITRGTRKEVTSLDAAALADIGWSIVEPVALAGDYNGDLVVDGADYAVWRNSLGSTDVIGSLAEWRVNFGAAPNTAAGVATAAPEPASLLLVLLAGAAWPGRHGRQARPR
ncbi:MAG: matrixin family metalloprotease [Planctomycetota bacterium]